MADARVFVQTGLNQKMTFRDIQSATVGQTRSASALCHGDGHVVLVGDQVRKPRLLGYAAKKGNGKIDRRGCLIGLLPTAFERVDV